jgi:DAK2 domain
MADRSAELPDRVTSSALIREAGMAFASANPSTFGPRGVGMLAASTAIDDSRPLDRQAAVAIGRSIAVAIAAKGGAELGDKTLLDVLVPATRRTRRRRIRRGHARLPRAPRRRDSLVALQARSRRVAPGAARATRRPTGRMTGLRSGRPWTSFAMLRPHTVGTRALSKCPGPSDAGRRDDGQGVRGGRQRMCR